MVYLYVSILAIVFTLYYSYTTLFAKRKQLELIRDIKVEYTDSLKDKLIAINGFISHSGLAFLMVAVFFEMSFKKSNKEKTVKPSKEDYIIVNYFFKSLSINILSNPIKWLIVSIALVLYLFTFSIITSIFKLKIKILDNILSRQALDTILLKNKPC